MTPLFVLASPVVFSYFYQVEPMNVCWHRHEHQDDKSHVDYTTTCGLSSNQQISTLTHHSNNSFDFASSAHSLCSATVCFLGAAWVLVYPLLLEHSIHHSQPILHTPGQQSIPIIIYMTHSMTATHLFMDHISRHIPP